MTVTKPHMERLRDELSSLLRPFGQEHVLAFWDRLDSEQRQRLARQVVAFDWPMMHRVFESPGGTVDWGTLAARALAPPALTLAEFNDPQKLPTAKRLGGEAIRCGRVAFVLVAGGQGTRLGFDRPKGFYPIGPVSGRSLFEIMFDHVAARGAQFGVTIPVYVMTSPLTHAQTVEFFQSQRWFGYREKDVQVFCQGVMPAIDRTTRQVLMAAPDKIATGPDGHGGTLAAMVQHGVLTDIRRRGVEHIFYGQIDNPLLQVCQPQLIGHHLLRQSEMTSQAIRKQEPLQRVGNFAEIDGRVHVIEYSDLPDEVAHLRNPDGSLKLWAGSIAVHVFERSFLERTADRADALPFHRAEKRVPFVDAEGREVVPAAPNAIKFERFIFDLLPLAERSLVCEVDAADGFAALKNGPPAKTETVEWVRAAMSNMYKRWLVQAGGSMAAGALLEINPRFALDAEALRRRLPAGTHFSESTYLV